MDFPRQSELKHFLFGIHDLYLMKGIFLHADLPKEKPLISRRYLIPIFIFVALIALRADAAHRVVAVSTSDQLQTALADVQDGDLIQLADGSYPVAELTGFYDFFFIVDPGAHFTVQATTPGAAILDGGGAGRILEYRVDTPGAEGWVTLNGLVFKDGKTTSFDAGGVTIRSGRSTFSDCIFQNNHGLPNTTSGAAAGAVLLTAESVTQFFNCSFTGNTSDNHGGAMLVGQGSTAFIHDSIFLDNRNDLPGHRTNGLGGAIHVFNGLQGTTTYLYAANTTFSTNRGGFAGGAIMAKGNFASSAQPVASPTKVVISNSTFDNNIALNDPSVSPASPTEGGGIMAENNVSLFVYNSRFSNNSGGLGGAVASFRAQVTIESSVFRSNSAFGRPQTTSAGQGGAIKSHSNDNCSDENNIRTGSLSVTDSFFEGNQAQWGGAVFSAGDSTRMFSTTSGCKMGSFADNRLPVTLDRITITNCSVDDVIGNHAVGGGIYGIMVDMSLSNSMVLNSVASGTDPATFNSPSQGHGGGASIRTGSLLSVSDTTFAGNVADHEGGGLHILGSEIGTFSANTFVGNEVSPGGNRPETSSEGAAIYVSPAVSNSLGVSGAINNSTFTDNIGLPIFDSDTTDANGCGCFNLVTYDGNTFYNNTYGDKIYRDSLVAGTHTAEELNTVVVDHGGGTMTQKSLQENNVDEVSPITTAALMVTPEGLIDAAAAGDVMTSTESFLAWSWNGGCAQLNQTELNLGSESTGFMSSDIGAHHLEVWSGGECSGASDDAAVADVLQMASPTAELNADPIAIQEGEDSTLSWIVTGATPVAGMISNGVTDTIINLTGSTVVAPLASIRYHLGIITRRGGATADETVYVDEEPPTVIFLDGFETGDIGAWSTASGE
ncbi:MAG: hypothetical protein DRJ65_12760 [Acidobacteria bacterium]|nr:MAG: hypothetical protein DRJ65_12760 [Acidobacteriota bacterium]